MEFSTVSKVEASTPQGGALRSQSDPGPSRQGEAAAYGGTPSAALPSWALGGATPRPRLRLPLGTRRSQHLPGMQGGVRVSESASQSLHCGLTQQHLPVWPAPPSPSQARPWVLCIVYHSQLYNQIYLCSHFSVLKFIQTV